MGGEGIVEARVFVIAASDRRAPKLAQRPKDMPAWWKAVVSGTVSATRSLQLSV